MKILAFLQNQWFKDPVRAAARRAKCANPERWDYYMLFGGCYTGHRLRDAFGDLCEEIVWANASPEICGQANACPPADPAHMAAVFMRHRPRVVLLFGAIACDGFAACLPLRDDTSGLIIHGPHPAARRGGTIADLHSMAVQLREFIQHSKEPAHA